MKVRGAAKKAFCKAPWQQMVIQVHGNVTPCCFWRDVPLGNVTADPILSVWNNDNYRQLRRRHLQGDFKGSGCEFCLTHRQCTWMHELHYDARCQDEQEPYSAYRQNIDKLKFELEDGRTALESFPTRIQLMPSVKCNIRCTYCFQHNFRAQELESPALYDDFTALLPCLDQVLASGGEPLFMPFWLDFIKSFQKDTNPYLQLAFNTNGTIFNEQLHARLQEFQRLLISISLDAATPELFERIRPKAKFGQVVTNLDRFSAITREKEQSVTQITAAIMKDNIHDIPNLVDFAIARKMTLGFGFVSGPSLPLAINSFNDPQTQMRGWIEAILRGKTRAQKGLADSETESIAQEIIASLEHLESVIPWEAQTGNLRISAGMGPVIERSLPSTAEDAAYIQFNPLEAPLAGKCSYYAPLNGDRIELSMLPGQYCAVVLGRDFSRIGELDRHIFSPTSEGTLETTRMHAGPLYDFARKIRGKILGTGS